MLQFLGKLYAQTAQERSLPLCRETFARTGDRLAFERAYFARRKFLTAATLLYGACGGQEYLDGAAAEIRKILREPTWVHPAHGDEIDLFAAETGLLLAEASAALPLPQAIEEEVREELLRRIAAPFCARKFWWEEAENNWSAVCMGNVAGTLYHTDRAAFSAQEGRIRAALCRYLDGFPADGYCFEGLEYWNFGFGAFAYIADMVCPDLLSVPKVREIAQYPQRCFLRGDVTASFSDCPPYGKADRGLITFLSQKFGLPLLPEEQTYLRAENCAWLPLSRATAYGAKTSPARTYREGVYGARAAIFHRDGFSLAVKAGNNGEPHNHNDVGSFILSADGGPIVADLGQPLYDRDYFSARRYENLAASSLGHSVPIVNGKEQCAGETYGGTLAADGLGVEFSAAYADCKKLSRKFSFLPHGVAIFDEFSSSDRIKERFICIRPEAAARIRSEDGFAARIEARTWRDHGGAERPVYLVDFEVPAGRTSAAFTITCEE